MVPLRGIDDDLGLSPTIHPRRTAFAEPGSGQDLQLRRSERRHHADGPAEGKTGLHGRPDTVTLTSRRIHATGRTDATAAVGDSCDRAGSDAGTGSTPIGFGRAPTVTRRTTGSRGEGGTGSTTLFAAGQSAQSIRRNELFACSPKHTRRNQETLTTCAERHAPHRLTLPLPLHIMPKRSV